MDNSFLSIVIYSTTEISRRSIFMLFSHFVINSLYMCSFKVDHGSSFKINKFLVQKKISSFFFSFFFFFFFFVCLKVHEVVLPVRLKQSQ